MAGNTVSTIAYRKNNNNELKWDNATMFIVALLIGLEM